MLMGRVRRMGGLQTEGGMLLVGRVRWMDG